MSGTLAWLKWKEELGIAPDGREYSPPLSTTANHKREHSPDDDERKPDKKRTMQRRSCAICDKDRAINQFPNKRKVSSHGHASDVCRACYRQHVDAMVDTMVDGQIACPMCPEKLTPKEIESFLAEESLQKYERGTIRYALGTEDEFFPCLSPICKSSQIHVGGKNVPIFNCQACKLNFCLECEVPWHEDESCTARKERIRREEEEAEAELQEQRQGRERRENEEAASAHTLRMKSKICPGCKIKVAKVSGCDHMTCHQCKHQYCWVCFADWLPIRTGDNSKHRTTCTYYRPNPEPAISSRPPFVPPPRPVLLR